ncbi:MAG TPA: hypothetical protein VKN99_05125 [Polyangia bacterium]|nr:hypothetical protein [Polyangia bacterium]
MARAALLGLLSLWAAGGSDDELRKHYTIDKGPDATLTAGSKGALTVRLSTKDEGYIHPDAPLRIKLAAEGAVAVERSALTRADAVDPKPGEKARELAFRIPIAGVAGASGPGAVSAELSFYLCAQSWCRPVKESLRWTVTVK